MRIVGGSIVPRKEPAITTVATHQNNFRLLVATGILPSFIARARLINLFFSDTNNAAKGELYWDDGDSLASLNDGEHLHFAFNYSATASGGQLDVLTLKKQNVRKQAALLAAFIGRLCAVGFLVCVTDR